MDCTEWQPYFAWKPVYVDAYDVNEMKDGKFSYLKWGWVERRLCIFVDNYGLDDMVGVEQRVWRFRLVRAPNG